MKTISFKIVNYITSFVDKLIYLSIIMNEFLLQFQS